MVIPVAASATGTNPFPPFSTIETSKYLIVANGPVNDSNASLNFKPGVGNAEDADNFELGANKAPVPSTSGFLDGGSSGGPDLEGAGLSIPPEAKPVFGGDKVRGRTEAVNMGSEGTHSDGRISVFDAIVAPFPR